jgi:hypothetical protein
MSVQKRITGLTPGNWRFRFRAGSISGKLGEWSAFFDYTVTGDTTPPPVPSKPFVTSVIGGVFVEWKETSYQQPIDFNRVDVYVSNGGPYTKFGSIASINSGVTYVASDGDTGPFTFKFTGVDRSGNVSQFSEASDPVSAGSFNFDTTPPTPPSGLSVTAAHDPSDSSGSSGYADVTWTGSSSSDVLGYYIRYGRSSTVWDVYLFIEHPQVTTRIFNLRSGTTYYFQVNATDGSNPTEYIPTTPVSVLVPFDTTAPSAPSGLVAVAGFNNIIAYWNRNSENDVDLGRGTYQFQISTLETFTSVLQDRTITGTVASFTGLTTGTQYYIRVRALDSSGNVSAWTVPVSATPGKVNAADSLSSGTIVGSLIAADTIAGNKLIVNDIDADRLKTNTGIVGKLFVGDDAGVNKITIDGTALVPAVYYGTGTFADINTPFYFDALGKFSLKDQLTWNGATLNVKGSLNVTQASNFSANINILDGADILMAGGSIRTQTAQGKLELGSLGVVGYNALGVVQAAIYANTGQLYAIGGQIAGWNIQPGSLTTTNSASQTVGLFSDGRLFMGPNFSVGADGSVTVSGTITAVGSGGNVATTTDLASKVGASEVKNHLGGTNITTINGGIITTGTINLNNVNVRTSDTGARISLDSTGLKAFNGVDANPTVEILSNGNATFKGSIRSGSTITGSDINTSGTGLGSIKLNGSNNQIEFYGSSNSVVGRAFVFASNEVIVASGSGGTFGGYPANAGMLSLYSGGAAIQVTNSSGVSIGGLSVDSSSALFSGLAVSNATGSSALIPYFRNIAAGNSLPENNLNLSGAVTGTVYIQF